MPSVGGFWSYAHDDDENDGGRILRLAERLQQEYKLLTGEELELFIDRTDLLWGDDWQIRIAEALERVTFFIPIITPTYFRRPECRKELLRFAREARKRDAEELILPIYYITVPELEDEQIPSDEAMAIVKPKHREELRILRLEDEQSSDHRNLVNTLAERIIRIAGAAEMSDVDARISPEPSSPHQMTDGEMAGHAGDRDGEHGEVTEDDEEGHLERMAKGEAALGELEGALRDMQGDLEQLTKLSEEATAEMEEADASSQPSFASRLRIANKLAGRLTAPAESMEEHAQRYVALLWDVDPMVQTMLELLTQDEEQRDSEGTAAFITGLNGMVEAGRTQSQQLKELLKVLEENSRFSRELRKPLRRFQVSLRNVIDAQAIMDQWQRKIKDMDA